MAQNYDSAGRGKTGLINMDNTCYLNSIFQCLAHTDPLRHYFIVQPIEELTNWETNGWTAFYFAMYVRQIWSDTYSSLRIKSLKKELGELNEMFSGNDQCDAQELLTFLLANLHDDLKRFQFGLNMDVRNLNNINRETTIDWAKYICENDSPIVDIFYHQMVKTIVCGNENCRKPRYISDVQSIVSLPLRPVKPGEKLGLYQLLNECYNTTYFSEDPLTCDSCNQRSISTTTDKFWSLPKILVILLKRIIWTESGAQEKIVTPVTYRINGLNMANYCHPDNEEPISKEYDLYAVVVHKGDKAGEGHYQTIAKTSHGTKGRGWIAYDDDDIFDYLEENVTRPNAYILFYRRKDS